MGADHSLMVVTVFRRLVVIGLVVSLGSLGLGCGESASSWPRYGPVEEMTCDRPDAPSEKLRYRDVETEKWNTKDGTVVDGVRPPQSREIKWSRHASGDVDRFGEWESEFINRRSGTGTNGTESRWQPNPADAPLSFAACSSEWTLRDQKSESTPTTAPKPKPTTTKASSGGSEDYDERLAKCYFDEERPGYDFAGGGQRDDAAMIVCLGRVKE